MKSKLTIEQAKRLRNDFECWQQDYDPKDDKEQYDMFGRGMIAMDMLIAGMYQDPVAYLVCNGRLYQDRPFLSLSAARISVNDRNDGAEIRALCVIETLTESAE